MTEKDTAPQEPQQPKGTFACLTTGFEIVAHRPGLSLIPLLLELFLWLGPRLSITPLVDRLRGVFVQTLAQEGTSLTADQLQALHLWLNDLRLHFNLFALLKPSPLLGIPLLVDNPLGALFQTTTSTPWGTRGEIVVHSLWGLMGWGILLSVAGLGLAAIYWRQVGIAVLEYLDLPDIGPSSWYEIWLRLVVTILVTLAFLIPLGGIATLAVGLSVALSVILGQVMALLIIAVAIYLGLQLQFTVVGIVQQRRAIVQAIYDSLILVQSNMQSFLQIASVTLVLFYGLNVIWTLPAPDTWARLVGGIGHAIITTALTAAIFVYYHEWLGYLRELQQLYIKRAEDGAQG